MAFSVPDAHAEKLLRLVASFSGSTAPLNITVADGSKVVEFPGENGEKLQGITTACTSIANSSPLAAQLLGTTPEQQAKIVEWLIFSVTELALLLDDKLAKINDWLTTHTLLVGSQITLADIVIYATISPAAVAFPIAQHGHFLNVLRWYDHIHAVADSTPIFPAASFLKSKLVPPPPPPPPAPKDKSAAAAAAAVNGVGKKGKDTASLPSTTADSSAPTPPSAAADPAAAAATKKEKKKDKKGAAAGGGGESASAAAATSSSTSSSSAAAPATPATSAAPAAGASADSGPSVDVLDLRVGVITKIGPHPNADSLYVEEIDVGEEQPRQVVSGLRKFVTEEKMINRKVVVVCNLKPAKMRDVMSYGMVLCASNDDHTAVDPIDPPQGAVIGERVMFEGFSAAPETQLNPKKKIFEKIAPFLVTDAGGVCTYKGIPFTTTAGPITASLPGAHIA